MSRCSGTGRLRSGSVMPHLGVAVIGGLPRVPAPIMPGTPPWGWERRPCLDQKTNVRAVLLTAPTGVSTLFLIKSSALEAKREAKPGAGRGQANNANRANCAGSDGTEGNPRHDRQ